MPNYQPSKAWIQEKSGIQWIILPIWKQKIYSFLIDFPQLIKKPDEL
jgi:hypothetical protein